MNYKKKLIFLKRELKNQKKIYQPTLFWKKLTYSFFTIFNNKGINNFRSDSLANDFFVPLFHLKRDRLARKVDNLLKKNKKKSFKIATEIQRHLEGHNQAFSDYRAFKAADNPLKPPFLHLFSENNIGKPIEQFNFDGKKYSRSSLNYLLGLSALKKINNTFNPKTVLEIGGGFGILGHILGQSKIKNFRYINLDLPPLSLITENYLMRVFGKKKVTNYFKVNKNKKIKIKGLKSFSSLCCWKIENLVGKIDLFVNFLSFQEMEPDVLKNYIDHIVRLKPKYILLRNLREGKQKKTKDNFVGVKKQIKFKDYIQFFKRNYQLVEKNVIPFGYQTIDNFHSEILIFIKIRTNDINEKLFKK